MIKIGIGLIGLSALYAFLNAQGNEQAATILTAAAAFYAALSLLVLR